MYTQSIWFVLSVVIGALANALPRKLIAEIPLRAFINTFGNIVLFVSALECVFGALAALNAIISINDVPVLARATLCRRQAGNAWRLA